MRTPHIDRLAASGVRFTRFFVATPVCSPSRATLLTGRIPSQHGVHNWIRGDDNVGPNAVRYLRGERAYTEVLAEAGYTCGLSGKWHLGDSQHPQNGFSFWYVHQSGGGDYNDAPMVRDGRLINETGRYITDVITDEALGFLDAHHADANPFYLGVHYTAPHSPWEGHPQEIVDSYDDCPFASCPQEPVHPWAADRQTTQRCLGNREMLKGYFAAVTAMDHNIGRIIDRVETLGLRERTLIAFVSDNGFSCGHHGFWGKGNGTRPRNMYENSILVPAVFSHPGRLAQGRATEAMVSAYDFCPTLLDYLGLPAIEARNLPGASFRKVLEGGAQQSREHVVIFDEYGPVRMIRTREWKYVHRYEQAPAELYDLVNDPDERRNLAEDPAYAPRCRELRGEMEQWFARYAEPEHDGLAATRWTTWE